MSKKNIIKIILLAGFTVILVVSSYAWFNDRSNPSISLSDIQVSAAEGLVIKLQPDSAARDTVDLNNALGELSDFELKQVSTVDASAYYTIDFHEGLTQTDPEFILLPQANGSVSQMISNGYIDFDFYLQTESYPKFVYIHKDTSVTGAAWDALRISLTYPTANNSTSTLIFGKTAENGITDNYTTNAIINPGTFTYGNIPSSFYSTQLVRKFTDRDAGRSVNDNATIDENKILFRMPAQTRIMINMKIWLEGGDIDCTNTLASTLLNVLFKFGSANDLLDAPTLSGNSNHTVNGLETTMEWATTNDENTVWTRVTDVDQVFTDNIIYVRIAEDYGVSPESYATEIVF